MHQHRPLNLCPAIGTQLNCLDQKQYELCLAPGSHTSGVLTVDHSRSSINASYNFLCPDCSDLPLPLRTNKGGLGGACLANAYPRFWAPRVSPGPRRWPRRAHIALCFYIKKVWRFAPNFGRGRLQSLTMKVDFIFLELLCINL